MKHQAKIRYTEIHPDIYRIVLPLQGEKPGPVNVYLFKGEQTTLLDTGIKTTVNVLEQSLKSIGIGFSDIDRIVLSHGHIDHYGAARRIVTRARGRTSVAAHRDDVGVIETGFDVSNRDFARFYRLMGVPFLFELLFYSVDWFFSTLAENCRVDTCLADGEKISLGHYDATVISTPGHSRGSICLYLEKEGTLFSGDHILGHITPNAFVMMESDFDIPWRRSQVEFYDSLKKIEALAPRIVYPAHGNPIHDLPATASMFREQFSLRRQKIIDILKEGESTVYRIARKLFPEVRGKRLPLEVFLMVSEIFTHLQVLEKDEIALSHDRHGKRFFRLA